MAKARVTLENISPVLLNQFKRLIFAIFLRLLLSPNVSKVKIHIFSLVHQLQLLLTLTFASLSYLFGLFHGM